MKAEQTRKCYENDIEVINSKEATEIIKKREPKGKFIIEYPNKTYEGIDNSTGDAWTEGFNSFDYCVDWLLRNEKECTCGEIEQLYKYDGEYFCADCLLELLEEEKKIKTFRLGTGYVLNDEFMGTDAALSSDEIVENLIGKLDIEEVKTIEEE